MPLDLLDLKRLAEEWRRKATSLENKHKAKYPAQITPCVMALETCAEQLEELIGAKGSSTTD